VIRISTITATAKLSSTLDLQMLKGIKSDGGLAVNETVKFGNQVTLSCPDDRVSVKLFRNGSVHMTGLKSECLMFNKINQVREFLRDVLGVNLQVSDAKIIMINSDFDSGISSIRRERFCEYLKRNHNDIRFSYEPCIYQGIVIKYLCNSKPNTMSGVCHCGTQKCDGKGRGDGRGQCRKVSIIVFHSGKIIITGAVTVAQVHEAQRFIVEELDTWRKMSN